MPSGPDRSCDIAWTDVYSWDCVAGQHVVITRFRGEWGCGDPVKEVAACGNTTAFEQKYANALQSCREPAKEW